MVDNCCEITTVEEEEVETIVVPESQGDKGDQGNTGNPGSPGTPGASAYDIWIAAGNTGNQAAFLASLKGDKGDTGNPGTAGTPGSPGAAGAAGAVGPQGPAGAQGPVGNTGPQGATGPTGAQGPAGSYTFTTGITELSGIVTNNLITGKAGGQTIIGGTAASENLILDSTSHATKGFVTVASGNTLRANNITSISGNLTFGAAAFALSNFTIGGVSKLTINSWFININGLSPQTTDNSAKFSYVGPDENSSTYAATVEAQNIFFSPAGGGSRRHVGGGTCALQREFIIGNARHSHSTTAGIITDAATLAVTGPTVASGTNTAITNSSAVYIQTANVITGGGAVTNAYGLNVEAPSGATNNYAIRASGVVITDNDIETTVIGKGYIAKSPNGTRWRLTPTDAGLALFTSL